MTKLQVQYEINVMSVKHLVKLNFVQGRGQNKLFGTISPEARAYNGCLGSYAPSGVQGQSPWSRG